MKQVMYKMKLFINNLLQARNLLRIISYFTIAFVTLFKQQ